MTALQPSDWADEIKLSIHLSDMWGAPFYDSSAYLRGSLIYVEFSLSSKKIMMIWCLRMLHGHLIDD